MKENITIIYLLIILSSSINAWTQNTLVLEDKFGNRKELLTSNIIVIKVEGYDLITYNLIVKDDTVYFESNIYVDSLGQSELEFVSIKSEKKGYSFGIPLSLIQNIDYSRYDTEKYFMKRLKMLDNIKRNLYASSALVLLGAGIMIPGFIVSGAIIIGCGVINFIIYHIRFKRLINTESFDVKKEWMIIK